MNKPKNKAASTLGKISWKKRVEKYGEAGAREIMRMAGKKSGKLKKQKKLDKMKVIFPQVIL